VGVTVPTCWYLLSNAPDTSHGHDDHGDSHGAAHDENHEEEPKEEEGGKPEDPEGKEEESEKSEDSDSEDEKKDTDTPSPDAKGGIKKRSESKNAIKAGENGDEVSRGQHLA
jgi:hypothetical protein